uniref:TIGR04551 family protein n=1 Tax=uncultured myxobacterium HF0200_05J13 TaxID=723557 RepID=E7C3L0_9BACT|nr:hypothetical protein [uncultured myxobacterium HF0200_05J13]
MLSPAIVAASLISIYAAQAEPASETAAPPTPPPAPAAPAPVAAPEPPPAPATDAPSATPAAKGTNEISLEEWNRDDWMLLKPQLALLELHGNFRVRSGLFRRLDFNSPGVWESLVINPSAEVPEYGAARYPGSSGTGVTREASFSGTDMRFVLEPTLNVSSNIQIKMDLEILENVVLGSHSLVPDYHGGTPLNLMSSGQGHAKDAISVSRLYAHMTALNDQLDVRVGRMPNHWGLGMLFNSGDHCLDCDYLNSTDRFSLGLRIADHVFVGAFDWLSNGPTLSPFGDSTGQALDAFTWDDASQWSMQVLRIDHPEDIRDHVNQGEFVSNYGLWAMMRKQARDLPASYYETQGDDATDYARTLTSAVDIEGEERRDGAFYIADGFAHLYHGAWELKAEAAIIYGSFVDNGLSAEGSSELLETTATQIGGAVELLYHIDPPGEGAQFGLKGGAASGDSWVGFGALDQAGSQRGRLGSNVDNDPDDATLNNFQFNPNYHVDLLLFRRLIGTVTDAWYARPEFSYHFGGGIEGKFAAIYSQAMEVNSTARCWDSSGNPSCDADKPGQLPLGLEFDGELTYSSTPSAHGGGIHATVAGGLLFPLGGFDMGEAFETSFAWTLQTRLAITF